MITKLRRDKRALHYKPLIILVILDFLNKQNIFSPVIPAKIVVEEFEKIMKKIGYSKYHNKGWMPFWHLSGDNILTHYSKNHQPIKKYTFKYLKPKSKIQLLSKVNYAVIDQKAIVYFNNKKNRKILATRMLKMLKKDNQIISNKILNLMKYE